MFANPMVWKAIVGLLFLVGIFFFGKFEGYTPEHAKLVSFQAQIEQMGRDQTALTEKYDAVIKENKQNADEQAGLVAQGINDYYRSHPVVRVLHNGSSCSTMSEALGGPKGTNGSPADGDASAYVSPYSPIDTEQVAGRLYLLQQLLIKDGVKVE